MGLGLSYNLAAGSPVWAAVAAVLTVGGVLAGASLGVKGYRAQYHYGIHRGRTALEGLVGAIAGSAQGGWRITPLGDGEPPPALPGAPSPTD